MERGSVSRSMLATEGAFGLSKAWFQAHLLRVTDPRSNSVPSVVPVISLRERFARSPSRFDTVLTSDQI
jgi:hypothetical protein